MTVVPLPGKVSRAGVSSEDDDVVMSSSQQLVKPFKTSTQVTVVTKPAAASSAVTASHVSHVVRTLETKTSV